MHSICIVYIIAIGLVYMLYKKNPDLLYNYQRLYQRPILIYLVIIETYFDLFMKFIIALLYWHIQNQTIIFYGSP